MKWHDSDDPPVAAKLQCFESDFGNRRFNSKCYYYYFYFIQELRVEDYVANRKGPTAGLLSGTNLTTTDNKPGGLFGSTTSQPSTGFVFGQQQNKPAFGTSTGKQKPGSHFCSNFSRLIAVTYFSSRKFWCQDCTHRPCIFFMYCRFTPKCSPWWTKQNGCNRLRDRGSIFIQNPFFLVYLCLCAK